MFCLPKTAWPPTCTGKKQWSNLSITKGMDFGSGRGVQALFYEEKDA